MKQVRLLLMAATAMMCAGLCSCGNANNAKDNVPEGGNKMEWVDLGLPSGLQWAACNVGANTPEAYGDYFAWGETTMRNMFTEKNYRLYSNNRIKKYNTDEIRGTVDNLTILQPDDDAATANLGDGARTPTREEWQELMDNTTSECTTQNGVKGLKFTGANGNSIFLPTAGWKDDNGCDTVAHMYWSASLCTDPNETTVRAWCLVFYRDGDVRIDGMTRYCGLPVRAVRSAR